MQQVRRAIAVSPLCPYMQHGARLKYESTDIDWMHRSYKWQ